MFDNSISLLKEHINGVRILTKEDWNSIILELECIEDNRGQWDHPGKCTLINSRLITMKNVKLNLLGIDETGHFKVMLPECDYVFPGKKVLEIPMNEKYEKIINELLK